MPGRILHGRFRIESTLGQGGMGEVLLAHDELLNRRVALKRLSSHGADPAGNRAAMLKEARRASRINDRRIAAIYDVLEHDDELLLVMEYVEGVTLRQHMSRPITLDEFWKIATQSVEALGSAHAHGVIHRDIKPENLMVTTGGEIKILDFGIAKLLRSPDAPVTASESTTINAAGTPMYMAPEAHLGGHVDERTDIFSLGVVFYELLAGRPPFDGPTYAAILDQVLNVDPPPLLGLNPAAGPELSRVVTRMLSKDAAARFSSSAELMQQLVEVRRAGDRPGALLAAEQAPVAVEPPRGSGAVLSRPARSARAKAWALVGTGVVALAVVGWVMWSRSTMALPKDINLAILAPQTPGALDDFGGFTLGYLDLLSDRLRKHSDTPGFQVATFADGVDDKVHTPGDARKVLGATVALVPVLEQRPDAFVAHLELHDAVRERLIASRTIQVPSSQPFVFLDRTTREAETMLGLKPRARDAGPVFGIRGAGTLRFYLGGRGRSLAAKTEEDLRPAVEQLEMACRTEPEAALARAELALAQRRTYGHTDDTIWLARAEASARSAVALDDRLPEAHRTLGWVLAARKRPEESLVEFGRALDLDPTDDVACLRLARTHERLGHPEREKEVYLAAIARQPHWYKPYWWLASWHYRKGNFDEAIHAFRQMIHCSPQLNRGYSSLGGVLILRGDYQPAIDTLKYSVQLSPTEAAFDNLGTAYFNSSRFTEAIDAYNQAFQFGHANYLTWLNLGDAYFWLRNRQDQAAEAYREGVRLGRESLAEREQTGHSLIARVPADLAMVFPKLGQPDSARIYIGRGLAADSANSHVQYCAAITYWQLNERARAMSWLERSVRGGYPTVWLRDSPMFKEWHAVAEFRALVGEAGPEPSQAVSRN